MPLSLLGNHTLINCTDSFPPLVSLCPTFLFALRLCFPPMASTTFHPLLPLINSSSSFLTRSSDQRPWETWETFPDPCILLVMPPSDLPQRSLHPSIPVLSRRSGAQFGVCCPCPRTEASYSSLCPLRYMKRFL